MDKRKSGALYTGMYSIDHSLVSIMCYASPLISLALVYAISYYKDFESVNRTHCKVPNVVPSISSCIGNATPQRYIWRAGIALMLTPRFFSGLLYYSFFQVEHKAQSIFYNFMNRLKLVLFYLEYLALATLTFVGSSENHDIHEASTILFMVFSVLHMWVTLYLFPASRTGPMNQRESRSMRWKATVALTHNLFALLMVYTYYLHNKVCTPYMYSYFASCELICVVLNVVFHCSEVIDFEGMKYVFGSPASTKVD
eukprot:comp19625_c1_seq1/m.23153 comp19625_c1_seq1/g.23153  ORF comp19625_c1_seq1/g.23153 comp19625_c1_seq1/m.23153 type:complete len:255 (-) comp19625_c1_seq1:129-893(-)